MQNYLSKQELHEVVMSIRMAYEEHTGNTYCVEQSNVVIPNNVVTVCSKRIAPNEDMSRLFAAAPMMYQGLQYSKEIANAIKAAIEQIDNSPLTEQLSAILTSLKRIEYFAQTSCKYALHGTDYKIEPFKDGEI